MVVNGNTSIRPPDGLKWRCLSVLGGNHLYVADETDPCRGLTSPMSIVL
jgi:hypothetical protein